MGIGNLLGLTEKQDRKDQCEPGDVPGKAYQPADRRGDTDATCQSSTAGRMADVYATLARVGARTAMAYFSNGGHRTPRGANVREPRLFIMFLVLARVVRRPGPSPKRQEVVA